MAWVKLRDGHDLHVRDLGRGKPVVLLHGFASQSLHWMPNVWPLPRQNRFILPDFRGFGGSQSVPITQDQVFEQYAHDVEDVLNHYGLENVQLGGISTGGVVALTYNKLYGFGRISRYLNIEAPPQTLNTADWGWGLFGHRQEEVFARMSNLIHTAKTVGIDTPYWDLPKHARRQFKLTLSREVGRAVEQRLIRRLAWWAGQVGERVLAGPVFPVQRWYAYLQLLQAFMNGNDTIESLATIKIPTTLMIGMKSRYFPPEGQLHITDHVPHARVIKFHRSGHLPIVDEPRAFQREFARFIAQPEIMFGSSPQAMGAREVAA